MFYLNVDSNCMRDFRVEEEEEMNQNTINGNLFTRADETKSWMCACMLARSVYAHRKPHRKFSVSESGVKLQLLFIDFTTSRSINDN